MTFFKNWVQLKFRHKKFRLGQKRIKTLRNLNEKYMILRPDERQGIEGTNKSNYYNSMEHLFTDNDKFETLNKNFALHILSKI